MPFDLEQELEYEEQQRRLFDQEQMLYEAQKQQDREYTYAFSFHDK